ncbi:helix-turn-helix domain-containing protein [Paracraurococcus lichenis]|uniref:HTH iclR-type domain-containing protein n=1 Tax=Paracraurococcus lichenis TaxID=3064888 RepID=A0ABT9E6B1_9PROT|nr:helix-turn-helix domain-containing protein [Paracraurococcus sp. LOR1-02]MDO9711709.1 hypothetical protein [Paracraurococcus sp. LOR1-02]
MGEATAPKREDRPADNPKNQVRSFATPFAVLGAFGPGLPALTVAEAAMRVGLDHGTALHLIHTLRDPGSLRAAPGGRRVRLARTGLGPSLASRDLAAPRAQVAAARRSHGATGPWQVPR